MPDVGGIAGEQLRSFIERIERLEEERKTLAEDIKEVFAEAKGSLARHQDHPRDHQDPPDGRGHLDEQETLLDYKRALGMLPDIPESSRGGIGGRCDRTVRNPSGGMSRLAATGLGDPDPKRGPCAMPAAV